MQNLFYWLNRNCFRSLWIHFNGLFTLPDICIDTDTVLLSVLEMVWKPHHFPNSFKIRCIRHQCWRWCQCQCEYLSKGPFTLSERERGSQNFFWSLLPLNVNSAINLLINHHKAISLSRSLSLSVSVPLGTQQWENYGRDFLQVDVERKHIYSWSPYSSVIFLWKYPKRYSGLICRNVFKKKLCKCSNGTVPKGHGSKPCLWILFLFT